MKAAQVNRAVVGARSSIRLAAKPVRVRPVRNMPAAPGPIRNRKAPKMTSIQRDSTGRISDWTRSPNTPRGGWR